MIKKKILHIITTLDVGGAEMSLLKLVSNMDTNQFTNTVICLIPPGKIGHRIALQGIIVDNLGLNLGQIRVKAIWNLIKKIRYYQPDLIQTWMYHADLIGFFAALICRKKIVWNIRCADMDLTQYRPLTKMVMKLCALLSIFPQSIITNSYAARDYHQQLGYRNPNFIVIPNGFQWNNCLDFQDDKIQFRKNYDIPSQAFCVGMAARFDPMKDHLNLLKSAYILQQKGLKIHFILCGNQINEKNEELISWIRELGLNDYVHLIDEQFNMTLFFKSIDLLVSSSKSESFPNVIGEAMAAGTPCIATDVGDSAQLIDNPSLIVPAQNPKRLAHKINDYFSLSPENKIKIALSGQDRIQNKFSLDQNIKKYETLYEHL